MYVRSIAAGCVAAIALNLPAFLAPRFHLDTTGAVQLDAVGHEARYGSPANHAVHAMPDPHRRRAQSHSPLLNEPCTTA